MTATISLTDALPSKKRRPPQRWQSLGGSFRVPLGYDIFLSYCYYIIYQQPFQVYPIRCIFYSFSWCYLTPEIFAYLRIKKHTNKTSVTILLIHPAQNRYIFIPSNRKKLFLLFSNSWIFCCITDVIASDCFSRDCVAICMASKCPVKAFLTSRTVLSFISPLKAPTSSDMAF